MAMWSLRRRPTPRASAKSRRASEIVRRARATRACADCAVLSRCCVALSTLKLGLRILPSNLFILCTLKVLNEFCFKTSAIETFSLHSFRSRRRMIITPSMFSVSFLASSVRLSREYKCSDYVLVTDFDNDGTWCGGKKTMDQRERYSRW